MAFRSMEIADNVSRIRERIAQAALKAGREPQEITLIGVSKKQTAEDAAAMVAAGVRDLGENYVQEALGKRRLFPDFLEVTPRWHLIGHLQSNKAQSAVDAFDLIQSIDSLKLARAVGRHAQEIGKVQPILAQIHLGEEATKFGIAPSQAVERVLEIAAVPGVALQGLMGIAPFGENSTPYFQILFDLLGRLPEKHRQILSMGMTADFEAAIAEGATMVRIGTAIFGTRI